MAVLNRSRGTLIRGRAAIGSLADMIIDINRISFKDSRLVIELLMK